MAHVAQLVEHRLCKSDVVGSIPSVSSPPGISLRRRLGCVTPSVQGRRKFVRRAYSVVGPLSGSGPRKKNGILIHPAYARVAERYTRPYTDPYINRPVAQWVEHPARSREGGDSNSSWRGGRSWERGTDKNHGIAGSTPASRTKYH